MADVRAVEIELRDCGERDAPLFDDRADARQRQSPVLGLFVVRENAEAAAACVFDEHAMIRDEVVRNLPELIGRLP